MADTTNQGSTALPPRDPDEYPMAIQRLGKYGVAVFDRVEAGLLSDGFNQQEADMLMMINLEQIIEQARREMVADRASN